MKKLSPRVLWLLGGVVAAALGFWFLWGTPSTPASSTPTGALRLDVSVADTTTKTITATITGKGFETQKHSIERAGNQAVSSTLIGGLPVGLDYQVKLEGGPCHQSSTFEVQADKVALVTLDCEKEEAPERPVEGPSCGDNLINQPNEQCDGKILPPNAEPGSRCSRWCTLVAPAAESECTQCVKANCAATRSAVDENLASTAPLLECILGADWAKGGPVPKQSCARADLLTCYCGSMRAQDCAHTAPAALPGPCVAEVLVGTGCTASVCVASSFMTPTNSNGKAVRYVQCEQDNCFEECFK